MLHDQVEQISLHIVFTLLKVKLEKLPHWRRRISHFPASFLKKAWYNWDGHFCPLNKIFYYFDFEYINYDPACLEVSSIVSQKREVQLFWQDYRNHQRNKRLEELPMVHCRIWPWYGFHYYIIVIISAEWWVYFPCCVYRKTKLFLY